jgi:hypothetical protein
MMNQTEKLVATQAKAIESAHELAQLAIENAMAMTEIHFDVTKEVVATAHTKAAHMLVIKDPKEALDIFKIDEAQEVISEVSAIQSKVAKVISKSNKEVVKMIELSIDDSKSELRKLAKEITGSAPAGSGPVISMFEYTLDASLQSFDQAYSTSKDIYASFEKSVDGVMSSFQNQFATASKPATKSRKAIAA